MNPQYIIHGKSPCAYCRMATDLLNREGVRLEYVDTAPHEVETLKAMLLEDYGVVATTFPQILLEDGDTTAYIGGYEELKEHFAMLNLT